MEKPNNWHRRQAMMLATQLPENTADARLIVQAVRELLDTFLLDEQPKAVERPTNVLPFAAG
jgi:hypothetical protein